MEFNLNTQQLFKCDKDGIGILNGINLSKNKTDMSPIIDTIGASSAKVKNKIYKYYLIGSGFKSNNYYGF
jgi:hypothetical protein